MELCYELKEYQDRIGKRLDFTAQIRLDRAKDPELLLAMRQAGINMVCIGFESPIAEELKAMNKHINCQEMLSYTRVFHKFGFLVHGMFIFGYPMEDGQSFGMTASQRVKRYQAFIRKARIDTIQILLPVPLPGTQLSERLKRQNRIYAIGDVGWEYYDGNFPVFEPDFPLSAEQMQAAQRKIMASFYRFGFLFKIGLNILTFPEIVLFLHNIKPGWERWYRHWRNDLIRFMGWIIIRKWNLDFNKHRFLEKLQSAKGQLEKSIAPRYN